MEVISCKPSAVSCSSLKYVRQTCRAQLFDNSLTTCNSITLNNISRRHCVRDKNRIVLEENPARCVTMRGSHSRFAIPPVISCEQPEIPTQLQGFYRTVMFTLIGAWNSKDPDVTNAKRRPQKGRTHRKQHVALEWQCWFFHFPHTKMSGSTYA